MKEKDRNTLKEEDYASYMGAVHDYVEYVSEEMGYADMTIQVGEEFCVVKARDLLEALKVCQSPYSHITLENKPLNGEKTDVSSIPFGHISRILDSNGIVCYETDEAYTARMELVQKLKKQD